jgi:hypothetical protein
VQPAKHGADRFSEYKLHDVGLPLVFPRQNTMAEPA